MHEVSIMEEAVRMAVETAKAAGKPAGSGAAPAGGHVERRGAGGLRFAFDVVCRDTMAEGASLEMEYGAGGLLVFGVPGGI